MAEVNSSSTTVITASHGAQLSTLTPPRDGAAAQKRVPLYKLYAQPAPIRTFPLPSFYPNNPLSLLHVAYAWVSQTLFAPEPEPSKIHQGFWSASTRSVHVTDPTAIRALWEQGFFGKGNLSRSEPNWLKREQIRRGLVEGLVSEELTNSRREERISAKWERARSEQEAIERLRLEEARLASQPPDDLAVPEPVPKGHSAVADSSVPAEWLELPTLSESPDESLASADGHDKTLHDGPSTSAEPCAPVGPSELLALPNSQTDLSTCVKGYNFQEHPATDASPATSHSEPLGSVTAKAEILDGGGERSNGLRGYASNLEGSLDFSPMDRIPEESAPVVEETQPAPHSEAPKVALKSSSEVDNNTRPLKRQKSVRFSPTVESTTFQHTDPPSPNQSPSPSTRTREIGPPNGGANGARKSRHATSGLPVSGNGVASLVSPSPEGDIMNKEYLQLALEEAFFLVFGLGALSVVDPATKSVLTVGQLFTLFRQNSYFPSSSPLLLRPDDPFLINYVVYHHFRSLGWVPRPGIKFGVDWMLYYRGPVFDHAEFGIIVLPAYPDPGWKASGGQSPPPQHQGRSWHWLHGINRVLSHVMKSLVLVYVDVPTPQQFDDAYRSGGVSGFLGQYHIHEIMVRRWSSNRNRK